MVRQDFLILVSIASCLFVEGCSSSAASDHSTSDGSPSGAASVDLPNGGAGIGLDDLRFSSTLGRIVSAAGRTGAVDLIDPDTLELTSIEGFTSAPSFDGSDQQGVESADEGAGLVFAVDRSAYTLGVIDPIAKRIVASVDLEHTEPDYVRYSEPTSEVWITNPGKSRIDVLSVPQSGAPMPVQAAFISIPGGVEGIAIDRKRQRAYTHTAGGIAAVDLTSRSVIATWPTGCSGEHGIPALDEERGLLFAGCASAEVVVLDLDDNGKKLSSYKLGPGATLLAYSPRLHHFYLRGDGAKTLAMLGVSGTGELSLLGTLDTVTKGHCETADDRDNVWVCEWSNGRLLRFPDPYPATEP